MSNSPAKSARPHVKDDGLTKRLLLQMELMHSDAQLRNFRPVGEDAATRLRHIQSRRDHVAAELKKITPRIRAKTPLPSALPWHRGMPMGCLIAAPRFDLGTVLPSFGFSGTARTGAPLPGISVFPPGTTGVIRTVSMIDDGVFFGGDIAAQPIQGFPQNPGTFNDHLDIYFWLQNWSYLIPFPAPTVQSRLTYSFDVKVQVATALVDGSAFGWSFVSVGETANFTGQVIPVDTGAAFPLVEADLNPITGLIFGQATVQRSFVVGAGKVPVVAVLVGFAAGLERRGEIVFDEDDQLSSFILIGADADCQRVVNFRYDPIPIALP